MTIDIIRDEIKTKLTGGVLELEIDDVTLDKIINSSLREIQRYIDTTKIITVPFSRCIDMSEYKINTVVRVYRTDGFMSGDSNESSGVPVDPMYSAQWQLLSGAGNMLNFNNYALNYASWNTLLQIRNTMSTDLAFIYDKESEKLYINMLNGNPSQITIEYVPIYSNVEDVKSDFWIDILTKLSLATTKVTLGRIRSRYSQASGLFGMDGETLLNEGTTELADIRERLQKNTQLIYGVD